MAPPVGEEDDPPVALLVGGVAVATVGTAGPLEPEFPVVITLRSDPQLAFHHDAKVVAGMAVGGGEVRRAGQLLGGRRGIVEQAHERTGHRIAHPDQHGPGRALGQWRPAE